MLKFRNFVILIHSLIHLSLKKNTLATWCTIVSLAQLHILTDTLSFVFAKISRKLKFASSLDVPNLNLPFTVFWYLSIVLSFSAMQTVVSRSLCLQTCSLHHWNILTEKSSSSSTASTSWPTMEARSWTITCKSRQTGKTRQVEHVNLHFLHRLIPFRLTRRKFEPTRKRKHRVVVNYDIRFFSLPFLITGVTPRCGKKASRWQLMDAPWSI